ncbi:MAG TPA: LLM class flavin-dependent oxidoreductase [Acidimicrobiales bacterium]|nr:LLM class flavin-dependent oxidoreductase [Acidimicrobiales bacterium]
MRVGITLPQFREDAETALGVARHAEAIGLDGLFAFDHLWPIGRPDRPALHMLPFLGALAVETERVVVGSLVARVGLFPDAVLVNGLRTVARMAGEDRFVAGLGVGDRLSRAENEAYGVPFAPVAERVASLVTSCRELRAAGVPVWVGGRSTAVQEVAVAEADALNLWQSPVEEVAARRGTVLTWAGQVGPDDDVRSLLAGLRDAGATWAVCAPIGQPWPEAVERIAAAAAA